MPFGDPRTMVRERVLAVTPRSMRRKPPTSRRSSPGSTQGNRCSGLCLRRRPRGTWPCTSRWSMRRAAACCSSITARPGPGCCQAGTSMTARTRSEARPHCPHPPRPWRVQPGPLVRPGRNGLARRLLRPPHEPLHQQADRRTGHRHPQIAPPYATPGMRLPVPGVQRGGRERREHRRPPGQGRHRSMLDC